MYIWNDGTDKSKVELIVAQDRQSRPVGSFVRDDMWPAEWLSSILILGRRIEGSGHMGRGVDDYYAK